LHQLSKASNSIHSEVCYLVLKQCKNRFQPKKC